MTIYPMPENHSKLTLNARGWLIFALVIVFLISSYLYFWTSRPAGLYEALWVGSFVALMNLWRPFGKRNLYRKMAAETQINSIELNSDGLRMNFMTWTKFIPWNDVMQITEPPKGRGLYIRTRRRFDWYVIPRRTDRYEEIRSELATMGIPILQASAPLNWGILFAILFCASLLCNCLTQDRRILAVNFVLALILGSAGAILAKSWKGNRRTMLKTTLGSFIPAVFSAFSLIFPFGIK